MSKIISLTGTSKHFVFDDFQTKTYQIKSTDTDGHIIYTVAKLSGKPARPSLNVAKISISSDTINYVNIKDGTFGLNIIGKAGDNDAYIELYSGASKADGGILVSGGSGEIEYSCSQEPSVTSITLYYTVTADTYTTQNGSVTIYKNKVENVEINLKNTYLFTVYLHMDTEQITANTENVKFNDDNPDGIDENGYYWLRRESNASIIVTSVTVDDVEYVPDTYWTIRTGVTNDIDINMQYVVLQWSGCPNDDYYYRFIESTNFSNAYSFGKYQVWNGESFVKASINAYQGKYFNITDGYYTGATPTAERYLYYMGYSTLAEDGLLSGTTDDEIVNEEAGESQSTYPFCPGYYCILTQPKSDDDLKKNLRMKTFFANGNTMSTGQTSHIEGLRRDTNLSAISTTDFSGLSDDRVKQKIKDFQITNIFTGYKLISMNRGFSTGITMGDFLTNSQQSSMATLIGNSGIYGAKILHWIFYEGGKEVTGGHQNYYTYILFYNTGGTSDATIYMQYATASGTISQSEVYDLLIQNLSVTPQTSGQSTRFILNTSINNM